MHNNYLKNQKSSNKKIETMYSLRGCIYGQAVGDALGVPYEFCLRDEFECTGMKGYGTHNQPPGTWSDDTSMALAICDSYKEHGYVDVLDIQNKFQSWRTNDEYTCDKLFDIGSTTATALSVGHGLDDVRSNGNGSLMRTLPLAFTKATDDEIRAVSALTHAHKTSTEACVQMVHVARDLIAGQEVENTVATAGINAKKNRIDIRSGGYVLDTFEASLWCLANSTSYEECVLMAVNLGNDTDTTASVAGGPAGIVYGIDHIPSEWLRILRGKEVIEHCIFET